MVNIVAGLLVLSSRLRLKELARGVSTPVSCAEALVIFVSDKRFGMDIYRFFHPHHNPRLHSTPVRQQEISELEQAAAELLKALKRAQQRTSRRPVSPILPSHYVDIIKAMHFVEQSLQTLCDAHPGDTREHLIDMINERSGLSGWEHWTSLLSEQLVQHRETERAEEVEAVVELPRLRAHAR